MLILLQGRSNLVWKISTKVKLFLPLSERISAFPFLSSFIFLLFYHISRLPFSLMNEYVRTLHYVHTYVQDKHTCFILLYIYNTGEDKRTDVNMYVV